MQHGHAGWACNKDKQHGQATWTVEHAAWACSMDVQHRPTRMETWTCSMETWTYSLDTNMQQDIHK